MTIDEIKAKALAFLKTAKEKICDFFEPVNNALFGKAEQKREDAESASKKMRMPILMRKGKRVFPKMCKTKTMS